ncbi:MULTISPECIES: 5'-nucleotidase [Halopseudomonas]|jgi:5'-nucleotidase|uniref:5'-nucleotidase n=1 Tax=Halopseudomonas formosensis TaxID=1002526 RepID=A0A1I5ZNJ4_9GAMM|nr:5'-nucleotidase [Halopseudomonas formosensis]MDX9686902.1 5'-nucleotidase [Halopseudomonas formosensis]MDY3196833.1 5'-nucleotidase [Pseudomonadaceae bacterium]NLC00825.1 5'-nucleotidase [Halopseudomonas formosensis]SFQ57965.1 5'-nucleotidase [Halopseudomonas formosensis]
MSYPIEQKLVIAVASSALFDLSESDRVFRERGEKVYRDYQQQHLNDPLDKGVAFPFVRRFLSINQRFAAESPVEVVLLSRNSAITGKRVFNSIAHHGLNITRAAFLEGKSPYAYIPAFNASLFLSANEADVLQAIDYGYPAGTVLPSHVVDDPEDAELRIAFDFDGVIADDASERVYKQGSLADFVAHETSRSHIPHTPGPLADLFRKLSHLQRLEDRAMETDPDYRRVLRTAIVTARNAPSHERVITTLEHWGVNANEVFFLGGMKKDRILSILKPHMFFDDQRSHLESEAGDLPMVHIPFGVANLL